MFVHDAFRVSGRLVLPWTNASSGQWSLALQTLRWVACWDIDGLCFKMWRIESCGFIWYETTCLGAGSRAIESRRIVGELDRWNSKFFSILGHSHGWIRVIETWHGLGLGSTIGKSWMLFDSSRPGGPGPWSQKGIWKLSSEILSTSNRSRKVCKNDYTCAGKHGNQYVDPKPFLYFCLFCSLFYPFFLWRVSRAWI